MGKQKNKRSGMCSHLISNQPSSIVPPTIAAKTKYQKECGFPRKYLS